MRDELLTSQDVCRLCSVKPRTVRAWRRGYYWSANGKRFFFDDQSRLPAQFDGYRWHHKLSDVQAWLVRLRSK